MRASNEWGGVGSQDGAYVSYGGEGDAGRYAASEECAHATDVIQAKRARVVDEMPDWQQLREAGKQIRRHTMEHLDFYLEEFEANCTRAGGVVHWARDAEEARRIIVGLVKASGSDEVIKIKSMTTEEIQLNSALRLRGFIRMRRIWRS